MGNIICCCCSDRDADKILITTEDDEEAQESLVAAQSYDQDAMLDPKAFQVNLAKSMLPSTTTVLSKNQNYDLSTLNNQANSGIVQQILNGVIVAISFEESWSTTGRTSNRNNEDHLADDEDDEDNSHRVYGIYDGDLLDDSVEKVVEKKEHGREQQFEQKKMFREVDIDFISRVDLYTHFGECIYSVQSPSYKRVDHLLSENKQKQKNKQAAAPPPPPPPSSVALDISNEQEAEESLKAIQIATKEKIVAEQPQQDVDSETAAILSLRKPSNALLMQHGGIRYDTRRRAISAGTSANDSNSYTKSGNDRSAKEQNENDESLMFSKSGRYEFLEIDFPQMLRSQVTYMLFVVRFPFSQQQLKTTVHYTKTTGKKSSTNVANHRKIIEKKIPRFTRMLIRVYDRLTKVELCRFSTPMEPNFFYEGNEETDSIVGMLYHNNDEQKWLFRATNAFKPIPPSKFVIRVLEGHELTGTNQSGNLLCVVEYPAGKQLFKTKSSKTADWNQDFEINLAKHSLNPMDKLVIKCMETDFLQRQELVGKLEFGLLDLFSHENATLKKQFKSNNSQGASGQEHPILMHDNEWFKLGVEGKLKLNFVLHWE